MSINPSLWGKCMWDSLHFVAAGYIEPITVEKRAQYEKYYSSIAFILPCEECRHHMQQSISTLPTNLVDATKSVEGLRQWVVDLHNAVNKHVGDPSVVTLEQAKIRFPAPTKSSAVAALAALAAVTVIQNPDIKPLAVTATQPTAKSVRILRRKYNVKVRDPKKKKPCPCTGKK